MREDLGGAGRPLERVLPTLQTSLTHPELPCTATAVPICKIFLGFENGGCRTGKFLVCRAVRGGIECGYRACLVEGVRMESVCLA